MSLHGPDQGRVPPVGEAGAGDDQRGHATDHRYGVPKPAGPGPVPKPHRVLGTKPPLAAPAHVPR
ncbi:MAG TPA: hypothetical protein VKV06_16130 [Acidimicrobiales bacterium]|nr:hypothetical protein [Acidimicrobiales bacterium]